MRVIRSIQLKLDGENYSDLVVELHNGQTNEPFGLCNFDLKQSNSDTLINLRIGETAFKQMEFIKIKWLAPENRWKCVKCWKLEWKKIRVMKPLDLNIKK